jgi:phytoene dehydrogenase-like protein
LVSGLLAGLLRVASYCGDLGALPAGIGVAALGEATRRPVRYIDGGWQTIVAALADSASAHGAELRSSARVQELLIDDGAAAGVRLSDGSEHRGRSLVLAGLPPARVARLLGEAGGCVTAMAQPHPIRAACLDVALSELPRPACPFVLGLDQPLYLSVHSLASKLAPGRGAVVQLLRYDDGSEVSAEAALAQLESLLDRAQPGWRAHVVHRRFAPGMVVVNDLPTPARGLRGRPAVDDTGLRNAFIAGDWVGPRGWLAGTALHSGSDAATAAMGSPGPIRSDGGTRVFAAPA